MRPARLLGHPEDAGGAILVGVFRVRALSFLCGELSVPGLEGVGDVLKKDQPEDDVLVLGRVHVVAQRIGCRPQLRLKAESRSTFPALLDGPFLSGFNPKLDTLFLHELL